MRESAYHISSYYINKNVMNKSMNMYFSLIVLLSCVGYISANACNFNVNMKQVLKNDDFLDRNITYEIVFNNDEDQCWLYEDCVIGLDQTLPDTVYTNPHELSTLRRINKLNAIPKYRSTNTTYIIKKIRSCKAYLWLPVHARIHKVMAGGQSFIIGPPKLYLRCPDQRFEMCNETATPVNLPCNGSSNETCGWKEIPYTLLKDTPVWHVYVWNMNRYEYSALGMAVGLTFLAAALCLKKTYFHHEDMDMTDDKSPPIIFGLADLDELFMDEHPAQDDATSK